MKIDDSSINSYPTIQTISNNYRMETNNTKGQLLIILCKVNSIQTHMISFPDGNFCQKYTVNIYMIIMKYYMTTIYIELTNNGFK